MNRLTHDQAKDLKPGDRIFVSHTDYYDESGEGKGAMFFRPLEVTKTTKQGWIKAQGLRDALTVKTEYAFQPDENPFVKSPLGGLAPVVYTGRGKPWHAPYMPENKDEAQAQIARYDRFVARVNAEAVKRAEERSARDREAQKARERISQTIERALSDARQGARERNEKYIGKQIETRPFLIIESLSTWVVEINGGYSVSVVVQLKRTNTGWSVPSVAYLLNNDSALRTIDLDTNEAETPRAAITEALLETATRLWFRLKQSKD